MNLSLEWGPIAKKGMAHDLVGDWKKTVGKVQLSFELWKQAGQQIGAYWVLDCMTSVVRKLCDVVRL